MAVWMEAVGRNFEVVALVVHIVAVGIDFEEGLTEPELELVARVLAA